MTIEICVILVSFRLSPYRSLRVTRTVPNRTVCERGPRERDKETRDVGGCRSLVTLVLCSHLTSFPHPRHLPGFAGVRRTGDEEGGVKSEMWGKGCEGTG